MISFNSKPVILTILENEDYQKLMGDIDALFIVYQCSGSKKINSPLPKNHQIVYDVTPNIRPDILLSQNKINQYGIFRDMAKKYGAPIISLYHNIASPKDVDRTFAARSTEDVFLSNDHAAAWGVSKPYIIPPTTNKSIAKISEPLVYSNKDASFNCIYKVLDNMANGSCIISPAIYELNNVINHGYNGFLYKKENPEKEKEIFYKLGKNDDLIMEFGANAQKTITEEFSKSSFTEKWNTLIKKHTNKDN